VLLFGGAAVGVIAIHLATNSTLGFHTDELYYLACGRHPALGYVDFPSIVPLLARLETGLLGVSPWTLRLLPSLLGGFLTVLSALYVRRLGGSLLLQGLALLGAIAAPFLLGTNWVFQTVTFDQVTWMVGLYWFLCLVLDGRPRHWTTSALMVDYTPSDAAWMCTSPTLVTHLTVPYGVKGLEQGAPVTFCQLKAPVSEFWGKLRNFS